MMNNIKFSRDYTKLWGQTSARLLHVQTLDASSLDKDLIEYDTVDYEFNHYVLPKSGKLIQLIFLGNKGIPFCTLRRWTIFKDVFYSERIDETFHIVRIKEED